MAVTPIGVSRPQRWDRPFGPETADADVQRILRLAPFSRIDASRFPEKLSLREILRNDARLVRCHPGDIVVRKGDYGNSAFFVVSGTLRVDVEAGAGIPDSLLGRVEPHRKSFWAALAQIWRNPRWPEARPPRPAGRQTSVGTRRDEQNEVRSFLQDVPTVLADYDTERIEAGEWFGEIAALGRTPRTATIFAETTAELLEIRWQGLRDIRSRAPEIKDHIDSLYRERSLKAHLRETPMFAHLGELELEELAKQIEFETYGNFDWYGSYRSLLDRDPVDRVRSEPLIAEEGHYPNGAILIRSGFVRVSQRYGSGERTVSYLGCGKVYGFREIAHNWRSELQVPLQTTLRAIGYVDVLRVPTATVEKFVLSSVPAAELPAPIPAGEAPRPRVVPLPARKQDELEALEFFVENRFINGTAAMLIDLDRCTRCDDCVRACAATHSNNPRFIRHGPQSSHYMVANACMHCADPVCMIGCPTGAIHRDAAGGQVVINDDTCIGCETCARSCPYENIRMVEIRDESGRPQLERKTHAPILKATKCDLCLEQAGGPACVRACPHDALGRIDLQQLDAWVQWRED